MSRAYSSRYESYWNRKSINWLGILSNTDRLQAERAVDWMLMRANDPRKKPFKKNLSEHGVILEWIARSRIDIDAARMVVLNAAAMIDDKGAKGALKEIAEAKIMVPRVTLEVLDRAIQSFGGAGVSQDTPLANMWANSRTLRIVDGPDEVHMQQLGKNENKRSAEVTAMIKKQRDLTAKLFKQWNIEEVQPGPKQLHSGQVKSHL